MKRLKTSSEEVNLSKFFNMLNIYFYNLRVLHWKTKTNNFDEYHELMNEYYDKVSDDVDLIAEILLSNDININSLNDIVNDEYTLIDVNKDYTEQDIIDEIKNMFDDILKYIDRLLNEDKLTVHNPGIRSELENLYAYYDKENNYKNKRRFI